MAPAEPNDVPIDIFNHIEGYVVAGVREKVEAEWDEPTRCYGDRCEMLEHANNEELRRSYHDSINSVGFELNEEEVERWPKENPTREQMISYTNIMGDGDLTDRDDDNAMYQRHDLSSKEWMAKVKHVFSEENCSRFQRRFGLDIWAHFNIRCPETVMSFEYRDAVAYLVLPSSIRHNDGRATKDGRWQSRHDDFMPGLDYDEGAALDVEITQHPSTEELQGFPDALKALGLEGYVHRTCLAKDLLLRIRKMHNDLSEEEKRAPSMPRPTLLVRSR